MLDQCLQEPPSYGQRHRLCIQLANEDLERITLCTCETIDGLRRIGWRGSTSNRSNPHERGVSNPESASIHKLLPPKTSSILFRKVFLIQSAYKAL